jgi:DNA-binding Lrp family transcriptional regulator|tara:strand:+ start:61 stop:303 length:243 start_codon:yes stop_codon:yes gene_type:complete
MQAIFLLIKCTLGHAYDVAEDLVDNVTEISEVHSISGQYDLLAKFYLPKDADIGRFVTERLQTRDNIVDTFTMITFKAFQ